MYANYVRVDSEEGAGLLGGNKAVIPLKRRNAELGSGWSFQHDKQIHHLTSEQHRGLSSTIDSLAHEFALCHLVRQLSLSSLALWATSGERKRRARSIDVNYANVTRDGAHWSVSPPKESIKEFNNVTLKMDTASASPNITSHISL
ncbi:hypothetical protein PAMP_004098 [Pampus punctatissimus]